MMLAVGLIFAHVIGLLVTTGLDGPMVQGDARSYFAYMPSLLLDRDLDLRNQFAVLRPEGDTQYPFGVGRGGRARNPFPIAPALLWLPGYTIGVGVDALRGQTATDVLLGYGVGAVWGTVAWCLFLVGMGAEATRRLVRRCVGVREAFPATVMVWLSTPALYYTLITPLYAHAIAWFAVSLMLWFTWRAWCEPTRVGLWVASGLAAGVVVAVRLQDAPLLCVPLAALASSRDAGAARAGLRPLLIWGTGVILGYCGQGLTSFWIQGSWLLPPGGVGALATPSIAELGGILFSLGYRGWISWTPIVLPGLVGLVVLARRAETPHARTFSWAGLIGIGGMLVIDLIHPFGEGAGFGGRRYVSLSPLIALGLAALLGRHAGPRTNAIAWVLLPVLTVWNIWLLVSYELLIIRHDVYPTLLQTVQHAVGLGPL